MVFLECATHEEPGAGAYIRWVEGYEGNRAVSISVAVLPGTCSSIVCFLKQKGEEGGGGRGEGGRGERGSSQCLVGS